MSRTTGEKIFGAFNMLLMLLLVFVTLYPLYYVIISAFSDPMAVATGAVTLLPVGFELASFYKVIEMENIWTAYGNTIFYAVFGTLVSMVLTILGAYPLSKRRMKGRKVITFFVLATMWFSAGMIPVYQNFQNLHLLDSRLGILLCFAVDTFNVILLRTFFENVPDSMEESAKMDGASDWVILTRIYLPLSVSALATITMYYFVARWNAYFWSMLLLKDQSLVPLQVLLKKLIVEVSYNVNEAIDFSANVMTEQTIVYATIVIAVLPMLVLYPFIQRFFVKGIMVGAIKG
ncbi:carbohydrate ABC transporter permease [Paenibacillus sp. WQ 127069]|uniref:Carbohydrate ABC transporter permease n=1 Tax=Paenibacillus baimaensis TaxID=2982185 RepID=A0ABT2UJ61_9BACL|nr:carbohydrate ABC transporter permease [Paenibacillus sp. WQ 127069]MCU6793689.1 carbohydrate ABC transporter permease [Paenibacillus sp. WQ 127069]